ncbi:Zn(II)2Cys6 transcription factor [Aspergillus tanneri]|uniref:Zn(2)-C6 fungal-type domain-containing protein n=1 Tax=Aspergillus tanneri TaxID=1220188 RepID=A0A5M9N3W8_9EURO|nr:uncharacterized protein ATNIH1004_000595 [Aspergillus tanneri]KAA8651699.1 hypothetical protein ATNIH1004_000595 [Aspergillus tanneri]
MEHESQSVFLRPQPPRFFKACRRCRKLKMRCDARQRSPCSRCKSGGHECLVDAIQRRSPDHPRYGPLDALSSSSSGRSPAASETSPTSGSRRNSRPGLEMQQFSPQEMIAPQSVMHSISVNLGASTEDIFVGESSSSSADLKSDVVERGLLAEEQARSIYERFMTGSKNFLPLFDPIRDTFDSIRSRSPFCFSVVLYLASRAVPEFRGDGHLQRVLQDEAQRLAEDSFFERPTKLETVQGMILLAAYSEKTWFSTALILRTALDSGLEKSLDRLLAQTEMPRSYISASLEDRMLVWQTRTWLISFTLELDVASGTGRKSRLSEVDMVKLRQFLEYPLSLPSDMRNVCIIELHQLRARSRLIIESSSVDHLTAVELPAVMLMLNYAKIYVLCASIARIQKLDSTWECDSLWKSLVEVIMNQLALLVQETAYRCQLTWAPTYPALTIAFVTTFAVRIARWRPSLIDQTLLLHRAQQISEFIKQPPYPDIHRTVSIFVRYASLPTDQPETNQPELEETVDEPSTGTANGNGMNWTMADSFGLFEEGQTDVFDFLPAMPS